MFTRKGKLFLTPLPTLLTLTTLESAHITQVKGSVSQDCPPLQTPITSPGLPYFCPTGYTSGVPNTPSSGLRSCWDSWQNSGKPFTITSLLQRIQLRKSQMEEIHRARSVGRGMELPCPPSLGTSPSQHLDVFTNPEALRTPSVWFYYYYFFSAA